MEKGFNNPMLEQVRSIPEMIISSVKSLKEEVRFALSAEETYAARNVYLIGSGDSHVAAKTVSQVFARLARADLHVLPSLEASRYLARDYIPYPESHNLAIGISKSGETSRVLEAVIALKQSGCKTLAITANPESRLASLCGRLISTAVEPFESAPEVRSYVSTQLALYMLAIRMGENKGIITMDQAEGQRRAITNLAGTIRQAIESNAEKLKAFARLCAERGDVEILGSGPSIGAAEFCVAKIFEATGTNASARDVEEFAHLSYFRRNPESIPTLLLAPSGSNAASRTNEVLGIVDKLGRPYMVITDGEAAADDRYVTTTEKIDEMYSPIYSSVMLAQMVSYMNLYIDEEYYRGHKGVWDESGHKVNKDSVIEGRE